MALSSARPTRPGSWRTGSILLAAAIVVVFAAAISNVPERINQSDYRKRDRVAFVRWARENGGRREYGKAIEEPHARYDIVCAPHYRGGDRSGADYRIYLLIDSHDRDPARVVRAVKGPLEVTPTQTGPKCGAFPPPGQ